MSDARGSANTIDIICCCTFKNGAMDNLIIPLLECPSASLPCCLGRQLKPMVSRSPSAVSLVMPYQSSRILDPSPPATPPYRTRTIPILPVFDREHVPYCGFGK